MSFYFSQIPSQFQNYCFLIPVLPYFLPFQAGTEINSKFQICQTESKSQQTSDFPTKSKESISEIQKADNFQQHSSLLKNQEQNFLQSKKPTAALQSQQIPIQNSEPLRKQKNNERSLASDQGCEKSCNKISKTIRIKKTKQFREEEYQPFEKKKRFQTNIRENQNRNIIPNEVNQIFSYIQKSSKSKLVVGRIFTKYPPSNPTFTPKKFYLYQSLLKDRISNYINETTLSLVTELYQPKCEVYSEEQQRYYNKVCRILIHHFLQEDSIFNILTSRRMHKDKKRNHLEMRRVLKAKVVGILRH